MNRFNLKTDIKKRQKTDIQLKVIQNGRLSTMLFMIGCFLNFIEYNESEQAIFQSMSNTKENDLSFDNELKAAKIAETVSVIFLIAMCIYANNAITTLSLQVDSLDDISSKNSLGWSLITFFDLIKVIGFIGAAIGYNINLKELYKSNT